MTSDEAPLRVLLIDSNVYFVKRMTEALQKEGFEVLHHPVASYALTMIEYSPPDIILCATELREMGAFEIVARAGTNERFGPQGGTAGPVVRDSCIRRGLMVRAIGDTIVFCPPLIITHAEIDRLVDTIRDALDEAEPSLRASPSAG